MQIIKKRTSNSFYLNLSIAGLTQRIVKEKEQRPLVANIPDDELPEFIGKHIFERVQFYAMANHTVLVEHKTIEQIVLELEHYLI